MYENKREGKGEWIYTKEVPSLRGEMGDFIKIHEPCATCAPLSLVVFEFCALRRSGPAEAPRHSKAVSKGRRKKRWD